MFHKQVLCVFFNPHSKICFYYFFFKREKHQYVSKTLMGYHMGLSRELNPQHLGVRGQCSNLFAHPARPHKIRFLVRYCSKHCLHSCLLISQTRWCLRSPPGLIFCKLYGQQKNPVTNICWLQHVPRIMINISCSPGKHCAKYFT